MNEDAICLIFKVDNLADLPNVVIRVLDDPLKEVLNRRLPVRVGLIG
jgi:hypothetical protein